MREKHWGGSFICPSCGLPRKRRKFPLTSTCRWCRWKKNDHVGGPIEGLPDRIAFKIEITENCWLWRSTLNYRGYGFVGSGGNNGGMRLAHRVVYEALVGPIPSGHHLHHRETCPRHCVNPNHLTPMTIKEHARLHPDNLNGWREWLRTRTTCLKGHDLTPENTYLHPSTGVRQCRTCRRNTAKAYRARRAASSLG